MKWIFKALLLANCLWVVGFLGKGYLLNSEIKRLQVRAEAFAQEHDLFPLKTMETEEIDWSGEKPLEKFELQTDLLREYMDLVLPISDLKAQQSGYYLNGQMGLLGFTILGLIAFTLSQRERDNLKISEREMVEIEDAVFSTPANKKGKQKKIAFSAEEGKVYFDGFALLKGFMISAKEKAFEIPYESIIECFFQPLKGGRSNLILLTTMGKVTIDDTISDYQKLFHSLKTLASQTPDPKLIQKPWFQGILSGFTILAGFATVFGIYLLIWG